MKPFIGPVYAWVAAMPPSAFVELPKAILLIFRYLESVIRDEKLYRTASKPLDDSDVAKRTFRAGAKPAGDDVAIGSWGLP